MGRFPDLRRRNRVGEMDVDGDGWVGDALGGSGKPPPPPLWHPPFIDSSVLPVHGADLNTGKSEVSLAPPPPRGQGWRKGGRDKVNHLDIFPAILNFVRKILAARTFARIFLGFFRFRTGKRSAGKLSRQKFLAGKNFEPYERDVIGRIRSLGLKSPRSHTGNTEHVFLRSDLFKIFWRENSYKQKFSRQANTPQNGAGFPGKKIRNAGLRYSSPSFRIQSIETI